MDALEAPFVTEAPGLHPTIIRDIHHIAIEGQTVRIFTIDKIEHPHGVEHRVNGDFIFNRDDLIRMLGQVSEFLCRAAIDGASERIRKQIEAMRQKVH